MNTKNRYIVDVYMFASIAVAFSILAAYVGTTAQRDNDTYTAVFFGFMAVASYCAALYVYSDGKLEAEAQVKRAIKLADIKSLKNPPKRKAKVKAKAKTPAKREGLVIQCNSPACSNTFVERSGAGRKRKFCCRKCVSYTHNLKRSTKAKPDVV